MNNPLKFTDPSGYGYRQMLEEFNRNNYTEEPVEFLGSFPAFWEMFQQAYKDRYTYEESKKREEDKKDKVETPNSSNVEQAKAGSLTLSYMIGEVLKYYFGISVSIPLMFTTALTIGLTGDTRQDANMELGNENYPGDWVYTKPDPTGNVPFNNPPAGFTPGGPNPETLLRWWLIYFTGYRAVKGIIDGAKVQQIPGPIKTEPKEEMKFITPGIKPYNGR